MQNLGLALVLLVFPASLLGGCAREVVGTSPPADRPHYPLGLALHPEARLLAAVSSNFDLAYGRGAVLLADLDAVDEALAGASPGDAPVIVEGAYVAAAEIPSFGNEPVFTSEGEHLLVATRSENLLVELEVSATETPRLLCGTSPDEEVPLCGAPPYALQLRGNDPFDIALFRDDEARKAGVATLLSSPYVFFFRLDPDETGAERLQVTDVLTLDYPEAEGAQILGVRGMTLRPGGGGRAPLVFALVERTDEGPARVALDLVWFNPEAQGDAALGVLPLSPRLGSATGRELALTPDGDALLVLLRRPDALARIELFTETGALWPKVGAVTATCEEPTQLAVARLFPEGLPEAERAIVTCFASDAVVGYEPRTLHAVEMSRFFGRGPYDVVIDADAPTPRAYVSFFYDDTIGVFDLTDDEGIALRPRGLIGSPRENPEGRRR